MTRGAWLAFRARVREAIEDVRARRALRRSRAEWAALDAELESCRRMRADCRER